MGKFRIFLSYILLSIFVAGLFGALHDQISYAVSPEYYTRFKFHQFNLLNAAIPERLRAAEVGILASWWMGLPLGVTTGMAGFIHRTAAQMRRALLLSLPVVLGFALAFALGGLVYGVFRTTGFDPETYRGWYIPAGLEHPRAFLCVAYMHNSAYLGGALAIPVAWIFHFVIKRRTS
ncbi:hypothetical protein [Telmatospirillum sp.]|uniref:hypothetical protein n=1 Tax=Telmatospirillum sp. TaxID=2079197 RepID=UPI0028464D88|nr:hypothetical protein [Telmatospirillum sp.]MDR3436225.1 hypothetical protein [Telmatospirillum sp.]